MCLRPKSRQHIFFPQYNDYSNCLLKYFIDEMMTFCSTIYRNTGHPRIYDCS